MHESNKEFWKYCQKKYSEWFTEETTILEIGSNYENGSIRDFFNVKEHIGVDWREGKNVDVVCLAHEMKKEGLLSESFDALTSASMLEHDPYWRDSVKHMLSFLKEDGIACISWGSANNPPHDANMAPDGGFHNLPVYKLFNLLEELGIYVHEFFYDDVKWKDISGGPGCKGSACIIAFKNKDLAKGERIIEELDKEDKEPK